MKSDVESLSSSKFIGDIMTQCEALDKMLLALCSSRDLSRDKDNENSAELAAMAKIFSELVVLSAKEHSGDLPYLQPVCEAVANWLHWLVGCQGKQEPDWKILSSIVRGSIDFVWEYSLTLPTNSSRLFLWRRRMILLVHRISKETSTQSDDKVANLALTAPQFLPIESEMSFRGLV